MILNELLLHNVGIFGGTHRISLVSEFPEKNFILIGGLNGMGKTTFLTAIDLVLFGKNSLAFHESNLSYSQFLSRMVNKNITEGNAYIELTITINDHNSCEEIRIKRSWHRGEKISDKLTVWRMGKEDLHLQDNWNTYIEGIVPSGITGIFFFDGEKINRLASEYNDVEIVNAIKAVLGINVIDQLTRNCRRVANKISDSEAEIQDKALLGKKEHIKELDNKIKEHTQTLESYRDSLKAVMKEIDKTEKSIIQAGGFLEETRKNIIAAREKAIKEYEEARERLIQLAAGPLPLLMTLPLLEKIIQKTIEDTKINAVKQSVEIFREFTEGLTELLSPLPESEREKIDQYLEKKRSEREKIKNSSTVFSLSNPGIDRIKDILYNTRYSLLETVQQETKNFKERKGSQQLQKQYQANNEDSHMGLNEIEKLKELTRETGVLEEKIRILTLELNKLENENNSNKSYYKKELAIHLEKLADSSDDIRIKRYILYTEDIMEEYSKQISERKAEQLSQSFTIRFHQLTEKKCLVENIVLNIPEFNITLLDKNGNIVLKSQLSAGERQMLALAILWGMTDCSVHKLPVIIDTPLSRLDSSHRNHFVEKYLANLTQQTIVLSTDQEILGTHINKIERRLGKTYTLVFDPSTESSLIKEGYFQTAV